MAAMGYGDLSHARIPPSVNSGAIGQDRDLRKPEPIARVRTGVVLAAGTGSRLRRYSRTPKMLQLLLGVPLVERAVRTLFQAGMDKVIVVYGAYPEVGEYCEKIFGASSGRGRVEVVYAPRWKEGNGASLAAAAPLIEPGERFVCLAGDHFTPSRCIEALLVSQEAAILVDSNEPAGIDPDEATKVLCDKEGRVLSVGKDLQAVEGLRLYLDAGVHLLTPQIFAYLGQRADGSEVTLSAALEAIAQSGSLYVVEVPTGCPWQDIDTPRDLAWAKRKALRELRSPKDGLIARVLNRPMSLAITSMLAPLRPAPNAISVFAFFLAVMASVLASRNATPGIVVGLLLQLVSVIDGVDGEIARATFTESRYGRFLDGILDRISDAAILTGVAVRALGEGGKPYFVIVLLGLSVAGSLLSMASKDRLELVAPPWARPSLEKCERSVGNLLAGRDGRLFVLAVFVALGTSMLGLGAVVLVATLGLALRVGAAFAAFAAKSNSE